MSVRSLMSAHGAAEPQPTRKENLLSCEKKLSLLVSPLYSSKISIIVDGYENMQVGFNHAHAMVN